jgi:hypothetical protein
MEMVEPFGWHRVDGDTLLYIRERLAHFETMTWAEILVQSKKQNHSIKVEDICAAARQRLDVRRLVLDDVVSLRLSGQGAGLWISRQRRADPPLVGPRP